MRREWRFVAAAAVMMLAPIGLYVWAAQLWPESVYLVLSPESAARIEAMYGPDSTRPGRARDASDDIVMMAFYIYNNVRIDFQCFAGGLLFGVGSIFFLVYNGLHIGAVAGHLTRVGYGEAFWGFVAGHSSFELLGAVLAGAAGLRIGYALVAPGARTRGDAMRAAAPSGRVPALRRRGDDGMRRAGRGFLVAAARAAERAQVWRRHRPVGRVAPVLRLCGSAARTRRPRQRDAG